MILNKLLFKLENMYAINLFTTISLEFTNLNLNKLSKCIILRTIICTFY